MNIQEEVSKQEMGMNEEVRINLLKMKLASDKFKHDMAQIEESIATANHQHVHDWQFWKEEIGYSNEDYAKAKKWSKDNPLKDKTSDNDIYIHAYESMQGTKPRSFLYFICHCGMYKRVEAKEISEKS